jgi:phosphopantetheine adenylyltransferase
VGVALCRAAVGNSKPKENPMNKEEREALHEENLKNIMNIAVNITDDNNLLNDLCGCIFDYHF